MPNTQGPGNLRQDSCGQKTVSGWHIFHKWSPWEQYEQSGTSYGWAFRPIERGVPFNELRQKRHCLVCNKMQDKEIQR